MSSLFSMLGGFGDVRVLDAFAGSGAMALEALSRGAASCVLNDASSSARAVIERNCATLGYAPAVASVTGVDVLKRGLPAVGKPFDLVFLDPPYRIDPTDVLAAVHAGFSSGALAEGALVVYEHGAPLPEDLPSRHGLAVAAQKRYGKTFVTYLALPPRA